MKTHYRISGMHCRSCELLVAKHLRRIPGVTDVRVDHRNGDATVVHDGPTPKQDLIAAAVHAAGYALGDSRKRPFISHDPADWHELLFAVVIVAILALLGKAFGILDL